MSTDFEFAYNKIPKNDGGRDKPTALAHWWDFWKEVHSVIDSYEDSKEQVAKSAVYYLYPPFEFTEVLFIIRQAYETIDVPLPEGYFKEIYRLMHEEVKIRISIDFKT